MKSLSKLSITVFISGLLMLTSGVATAASNTGKITLVHLNATVGGRDMCVKMLPALPGLGWACIYNNNLLRTQTTTLLREAYEQKKNCSIFWNSNGFDGLPAIVVAECF